MRFALALLLPFFLMACAGSGKDRNSVSMTAADLIDGTAMQSVVSTDRDDSYVIGATDLLRIMVFQVPDLSSEQIRVDAAGDIQMPLIGSIRAQGRTPLALAREIESRLGERYLQNPQVSVSVSEAASQKITVDGAVTKPGVYKMQGRTTLLQAVAMAEGPTRVAALNSVAVFREVDGRRMVAVFDLASIRAGQASDPEVIGNDTIIVDTSRLNSAMREILAALPALASFAYY